MARQTTPKQAVGIYWFIDTAISRDLAGARLRMREMKQMGFTEVWIAVRNLTEIGDAPSSLLCDNYRDFLKVAVEEADHLELGIIPFIMPCGLGYLEAAHYEVVVSGVAAARKGDGGRLEISFGKHLKGWAGLLRPHRLFAYRVESTILGRTIQADSVRLLNPAKADLRFALDGNEKLVGSIDRDSIEEGEEVLVSLITRHPGEPTAAVPVPGCGPTDVTAPAFRERLREVVRFHEQICGGHRCYIGVAFDEPNIHDGTHENSKRERERIFYRSESLKALIANKRGFDLDDQIYALNAPASDIGYGLRFAYFECIQDALMDAMEYAMEGSSVPILGTHNWVGDRDRAIYNTFDEMQFTRTRAYGATDISGFQADFDYAAVEPLIAFQQKESMGRERAMIMTDHFREWVDTEWLLYTCERHAALGVDYMMLHAFGHITGDPPLWTKTESWPSYREARGFEYYTARMKQLAELRDYRGKFNALLVYPRYSRLVSVGDRFVVREWDKVIFSLYRAHHAPLTLSQSDLDSVVFKGGTASYQGHSMRTIILPYFTAMRADQLRRLGEFHRNGGNLIFTKPNYILADDEGKASEEVREIFESLFCIDGAPELRRFADGQTVQFAGREFHAHCLPEGHSLYDDCYLDFGDGKMILEATSAQGGKAVLVGFETTALSYGEDLHRCLSTDTVAFWDLLMGSVESRLFSCTTLSGEEDYFSPGMIRQRGEDLLVSVHRRHDEALVVRAGESTIFFPAGKATEKNSAGANLFVFHAEEKACILYNPLPQTLFEADLGKEIASVITYDGQYVYVHFEGSRLRMALPPQREMRFGDIAFGARDPQLPSGIGSENGQILEARTERTYPGRTILRVRGPEKITATISLSPALGRSISARCMTTAKPALVEVVERSGRLEATITAEIFPSLENDLEIVQS